MNIKRHSTHKKVFFLTCSSQYFIFLKDSSAVVSTTSLQYLVTQARHSTSLTDNWYLRQANQPTGFTLSRYKLTSLPSTMFTLSQ